MKINRKKKRFSQEQQELHVNTKLFKEAKFDSSSDDIPSEDDSPFKRNDDAWVWKESSPCIEVTNNMTPSKSESVEFEATGNGILNLEVSHNLNNSSELELQSFDNVLDEFISDTNCDESRIIPGWEDISENSTPQPPKKKAKKSKDKSVVKNDRITTPRTQLQSDEILQDTISENCTSQPFQKKTKNSNDKRNVKNDSPTAEKTQSQSYETPEGTILVLRKNEIIYFYGLTKLTVLHGKIEVFGHILTKNSSDIDVYSSRGSSLFYLKNITKTNISVETYLPTLKILKSKKLYENCAIVLCKRLEPSNILFIEKHMSQQIFPKIDSNHSPRVIFQPEDFYNYLKPDPAWNGLINNIESSTVMFMCGGKGVGKSCFMRFVINQLLLKYNAVKIIDLDPGQSEFTVPGCISIVKVSSPLFGGSYTHLLEPEKCIISNINIAYEPDRYITAVKHLLNFSFEENIPTLVNFMGFTHGIGINILSAAICLVKPTDVVQIKSQNNKNNYKCALTPEIVVKNSEIFVSVETISYNLLELESLCDNFSGWVAEPRQLREMSILSYLSRMIDENSVFQTKGVLSRITLSDIKINDLSGSTIHPAVVNANLVALCTLQNEKDAVFQCFGWGIVRGIDIDLGYLVLLSENFGSLEKITHLVFNGVTLPPSVYMTPDAVTGLVPYVAEGMLARFGQMPKRARRSVKT